MISYQCPSVTDPGCQDFRTQLPLQSKLNWRSTVLMMRFDPCRAKEPVKNVYMLTGLGRPIANPCLCSPLQMPPAHQFNQLSPTASNHCHTLLHSSENRPIHRPRSCHRTALHFAYQSSEISRIRPSTSPSHPMRRRQALAPALLPCLTPVYPSLRTKIIETPSTPFTASATSLPSTGPARHPLIRPR